MLFKGSGVAIVTPFKEDMSVDYEVFGQLIDFHLENKTDAIIVAGTTGEAAALTDEEHLELVEFAVERVDSRIPVIAGTGSNNTRDTIRMSRACEELGVDGLLIVTPYYNKPSQAGLEAHFLAVANHVNTPIILYTVPGRTGVNLEPETVYELSKHENIVAIKDATGDLSYAMELKKLSSEDFALYSGNDDLIVPLMSLGFHGVISVLANALPEETHEMTHAYMEGRTEKAAKMQLDYKEFIDSLFIESNPIPIKAAMGMMGYGSGSLRLPLVDISEPNRKKLEDEMKSLKLI